VAAVYLLAALAVISGSPASAFAACVFFGVVRGLAITVAGTARSAEGLRALVARIDSWARPSLLLAGAIEISVAAVAAWMLAGPAPAAVVTAALAAVVAAGTRRLSLAT
jgi:hypothetical protein